METPLTPLEFMRRARRLYRHREAVVDGADRWTYEQFFVRCEAWAAWLHAAGVRQGDRVAYIAPNTHAHLEGFYAVPMLGAVLVPINYRLTADDFRYLITHSGATVVCAGIHMSDVPSFPYDILWGERTVRSVANLTRRDGEEFFRVVRDVPLRIAAAPFPLDQANQALSALRAGQVQGAAVLVP